FNDTATTEIYTLSLHDALPICSRGTFGGCLSHLRNCHGPTAPRFDDASQGSRREFWQKDDAAIRVNKELDPIPRFQVQRLANSLRYRRLTLHSERRLHLNVPITSRSK